MAGPDSATKPSDSTADPVWDAAMSAPVEATDPDEASAVESAARAAKTAVPGTEVTARLAIC
jgi:hypothetical protein